MTKLTGKNLINGNWVGSSETISSVDLEGIEFAQADEKQVDETASSASTDFRGYSSMPRTKRAVFLRSIADEIDVLGDEITAAAQLETGLPAVRLEGERSRTTGQLKMFADLLEKGDCLDARITEAIPDR